MALRYLTTHLSRADSSMGEKMLNSLTCARGLIPGHTQFMCKQFVQCLSVCAPDTILDRWHQNPLGAGCVIPVLVKRVVYEGNHAIILCCRCSSLSYSRALTTWTSSTPSLAELLEVHFKLRARAQCAVLAACLLP